MHAIVVFFFACFFVLSGEISAGVRQSMQNFHSNLSGVEWKNDGKKGTAWKRDAASYAVKGIDYDRNGNIKSLQRTAGGALVDDLHYSYMGNRLTGLSERIRTAVTGDAYAPGVAEYGTYTYDANGNLTGDSQRGMTYGYNHLNLLKNVDRNGVPVAKYDWLANGTKLRVRDGEGVAGFDYVSSLTYRKDAEGLHLETAHFGDGVIRVDKAGRQEVNYFICDRLGSVRVIVDGAGNVLERNDYYPFGARQARKDYPQLSENRYKYNGKEEQVTGGLGFLDYGARMYDMSIGRWFGVDPLADRYASLSGYALSGNNPLLLVDADGQYFTHYVDKNYDVLFQTDDGSDDVVMAPDEYVGDFKKYAGFSSGMDHIFNSLGWNRFWKDEFGLAERRFSEMELMFLDGFNTGWSRNNAAKYLLNPTIGNLMAMSFSEALSQWTNLELVVGNLSAGISGWTGIGKMGSFGRGVGIGNWFRKNTYADLLPQAIKTYSKKAGKTEYHHIIPQYMGGPKNGATVPLNGAYHQLITNEFRKEWSYGNESILQNKRFNEIVNHVYKKWPLPPGYDYKHLLRK